jgi:acyl-CoA thioester hydrolase
MMGGDEPVVHFSVGRPFILRVTVGPHEIDAQGHASNVAVLDWMNRAAIAHSAALGFDADAYRRLGGMFVVRRHVIDYHAPAQRGDELLCATWPSRAERATAERRHEIVRALDGRAIATGVNTWVYIDSGTRRPRRMPPELRAAFDPAAFA